MNKSAANPAEFEQKILNLVKNRKYLDFVKSHAFSGAGLGGALGAGMNVAGTAAKQMRGDMHDESAGDVLKQYLGAAAKGAVTGGAIGAGLGGMRGIGVRRGLRSGQLNEVKNMLRGGANPESLYNELIAGGHANPVTMGEYLQKGLPKKRITDYAAEHMYSEPAKLPAETMALRDKAKEGIESFAISGNRAHLDAAGLSNIEKDILVNKHREISAAGGSAFEHPEYNDLKERMLNARHLTPAARPVPATGGQAGTEAQLSHLDSIEADLRQKHDEHFVKYTQEGDRHAGEQAAHINKKLTSISRAKHHANEYASLRETDPEKALEHMRQSYKHMSEAGIVTPSKAKASAQPPAASPSAASTEVKEEPIKRNYEEQKGAPLEDKKRSKGLLAGLKEKVFGKSAPVNEKAEQSSKELLREYEPAAQGKRQLVPENIEAKKPKPSQVENIQNEVAGLKAEEAARTVKPELAPLPNTGISESRRAAMRLKPSDITAGVKKETLSNAEKGTSSPHHHAKQNASMGESRKLVPEGIEKSVEVSKPSSAASEEAKIDAAKKEIKANRPVDPEKAMIDAETEKAKRMAEMEQAHMTQEQANELARKMTSLGVK